MSKASLEDRLHEIAKHINPGDLNTILDAIETVRLVEDYKARIADLRDAAREFLEIENDLRGFDGDKRGMLDALYEAKDRLRAALREGEKG